MQALRQDNYEIALSLARDGLRSLDAARVAERSGTQLTGESVLSVRFCGEDYLVRLPSGEVSAPGGGEADIREKILLLHYLSRADGTAVSGEWKRFAQLADGQFYHTAFAARAEGRLLRICLAAPPGRGWQQAAMELDGKAGCLGGDSVITSPLSRVPVMLAYWRGDEELPPAASILFDGSLNHYLCTEDAAVLCDILLSKLRDRLRGPPYGGLKVGA